MLRFGNLLIFFGFILFITLVCPPGFAQAADTAGRKIMVWQLEAKTGVSEKDIESLSGYLTSQVEQYSGSQVISEADVNTVLKTEESRQRCGVGDGAAACMVEVGNALGVPEAVAGDLGKVGEVWILNLRRMDLRRVKVIKRSSRQAKGESITVMVEALPSAVAELFGKTLPPAVTKAPPSPKGMSTYQKAAYSTFFPGLALVTLGGIGSWQVKEAWDDHKNAPVGSKQESDAASRHDAWKAVATTGYVVGGALVATGITLWILDAVKNKPPGEDEKPKPSLSFMLAPGEKSLSVGVMGRW